MRDRVRLGEDNSDEPLLRVEGMEKFFQVDTGLDQLDHEQDPR